MKNFKKIAMASVLAASLFVGNAYAFRLHVTNHTLNDVKMTCQGGDCAALTGVHETTLAKASDAYYQTMTNFRTEVRFSSTDDQSSCTYLVKHIPNSSDGVLTADKLGCTGAMEGSQHNDADHVNSYVNIVLTAK